MTHIDLLKKNITITTDEIRRRKELGYVRKINIEADLIKWQTLVTKLEGADEIKISQLDNSILSELAYRDALADL
tara:strand:- start:687 stop:911 length:225 start_codon:yes stop_codon:yes gene_type:complete